MTSWVRLVFGLLLMLLLASIPFATPLAYFKPLWGLLFVLYVQYTLPKQYNLWVVLGIGLMLDAFTGGVIGLQATALVFTAWISSKQALRFRLFPMAKQLMGIFGLCMLYQVICLSLRWFLGFSTSLELLCLPPIMSTLGWPWLQFLTDRMLFPSVR